MSWFLVVAQVGSAVLLGSLVLALVVGAALALNGRIDAREVLEVALGDDGPAARPHAPLSAAEELRSSGSRAGASSGVLDLRARLAPPPR